MSTRAWPNIRVLRDVQRREAVAATELQRKAYLYLARNTALPSRVRGTPPPPRSNRLVRALQRLILGPSLRTQVRQQAQLALSSRQIFPNKSRPTEVKERCTLTGRGRGVLSKGLPYGLCRVSAQR